jgi:protein-disulfide isomerase
MHLAITVMSLCALTVTGLLIRRELFQPNRSSQGADPWARLPKEIPNWDEVSAGANRVGPVGAPITVVVFGDLECPACRAFELGPLRTVVARYRNTIATVYRHFPLSYHAMARPAAVAAECAAAQGKFNEFHERVLERQDSLAHKSFLSLALESGVRDSAVFMQCLQSTGPAEIVEADARLGLAIPVRGTPTVIVNGRLLPTVPDEARLDSIVRDLARMNK